MLKVQFNSLISFMVKRGVVDGRVWEVISAMNSVIDAAEVVLEASGGQAMPFAGHRILRNAHARLAALDLINEAEGEGAGR